MVKSLNMGKSNIFGLPNLISFKLCTPFRDIVLVSQNEFGGNRTSGCEENGGIPRKFPIEYLKNGYSLNIEIWQCEAPRQCLTKVFFSDFSDGGLGSSGTPNFRKNRFSRLNIWRTAEVSTSKFSRLEKLPPSLSTVIFSDFSDEGLGNTAAPNFLKKIAIFDGKSPKYNMQFSTEKNVQP